MDFSRMKLFILTTLIVGTLACEVSRTSRFMSGECPEGTYEPGARCQFTCKSGTTGEATTSQCTVEGWSPLPNCVPDGSCTGLPLDLPSGVVCGVEGVDGVTPCRATFTYPPGTTGALGCQTGYTGSPSTFVCELGEWKSSEGSEVMAPVCDADPKCEPLDLPGFVVSCTSNRVGATCTVSCESAGTTTCSASSTSYECMRDVDLAEWMGVSPDCSCDGTPCGADTVITSANAVADCTGEVLSGDSCNTRCADSYSGVPQLRTCVNGAWSGKEPSCALDSLCAEGCGDRGVCSSDGTCDCAPGWFGDVCDKQSVCPTGRDAVLPSGTAMHVRVSCPTVGAAIPDGAVCEAYCAPGFTGDSTARRCVGSTATRGFSFIGGVPVCVEETEPACTLDCGANGACNPEGGCTCAVGYSGFYCQKRDCPVDFCGGNGDCYESLTKELRCSCRGGYIGERCDTLPTCDLTCGDKGDCVYTAAEGMRCACKEGFSGESCTTPPDVLCTLECGRGSCVIAGSVQSCDCPPGFFGDRCQSYEATCDINCGDFGECVLRPGSSADTIGLFPTCVCKDGWTGRACEIAPTRPCLKDCANGKCVLSATDAPMCICDAGFRGEFCEIALCTRDCGHGVCVTDGSTEACKCKDNFVSSDTPCDTPPACSLDCGSFGECFRSAARTEHCICKSGYRGDRCQITEPTCDMDCGSNGHCMFLAATADSTRTMGCYCRDGFTGDACEISRCDLDCGRGRCLFNSITDAKRCLCYDGYTGSDCKTVPEVPTCAEACGEHGVCSRKEARDGTVVYGCTCKDGFSGPRCTTPPDTGCDPACSRGECVRDIDSGDGKCRCPASTEGETCDWMLSCPNDCSGRGRCFSSPDGPMCKCFDGYTGRDCSVVRERPCPGDCSGQGVCVKDKGVCRCNVGFSGRDCGTAEPATPMTCPEDCSGRGRCDTATGTCHCHPGFAGDACDEDPCSRIDSCIRCSSIRGCVFCSSSGQCVNSHSFDWTTPSETCLRDSAVIDPPECPREKIDTDTEEDPVRTRIPEGSDTRFRVAVPAGAEKCIRYAVAEGEACMFAKDGAEPTRTDFTSKDCTTATKRMLEICFSRDVTGRRLLVDGELDVTITSESGEVAGDTSVVDGTAASGTASTSATGSSTSGTGSSSSGTGSSGTGSGTSPTGESDSSAASSFAPFAIALLIVAALM